jgi:hypothetical protein
MNKKGIKKSSVYYGALTYLYEQALKHLPDQETNYDMTNIQHAYDILEEFIEKHENGETNANISKMGRK